MLERSFSAEMDLLGEMLGFILGEAKIQGFSPSQLFKIELVAEEALVNVIHYAYPEEKGSVTVEMDKESEGYWRIRIKDQGVPFDPLDQHKAHDDGVPLEEMRDGGWGIDLIKKSVDRLEYHHDGVSNTLTLFVALS